MNLPRRRAVVFFAVLLVVALGLLVSTLQGRQAGVATGGVPASVVVLPGLAAAGVAALAILATDRREATRLEHERQTRLRDERLEAYTAYIAACDRLHEPDYSPAAMAEFRKTLAVLRMVSEDEDVKKAAKGLSDFVLVRQFREEQRGESEANRKRIDAGYGAVLGELLIAAQRDLDISPGETSDSPGPLREGEGDG